MVVIYTFYNQSDSEGSLSSGDLDGQQPPLKCRWSLCGEWFSQLELLAAHVSQVHAVSGKGGLFYCGWQGCSRGDRGFNARYKMLVHVRTHTNEKPHHCYQCDKSFSRAENLKIHARSHTGERPYVCPVVGCGKAYSNSSDRFKHTRTHSVDKPYVCKVAGCPKRYTDPSSLRKHVKTYRHFPPQPALNHQVSVNPHHGKRMEVESVEATNDELERRLLIDSETKKCSSPVEVVEMDFGGGRRSGGDDRLGWREGPETRRSYSVWPAAGFLHWYDWAALSPPQGPLLYEQQQDSPLDLSVAVKLRH